MTINDVFNRVVLKVKEPTCTIFEAVTAVQDVIVSHLYFKRSEHLVAEDPLELTFKASQGRKFLPDECIDIAGRPALADGTKLKLLKGKEDPVLDDDTPQYYRTMGKQLKVFPAPAEDTVITVPVYERPDAPTDLDEDLPFYGMFDSVFVDACSSVLQLGVAAVREAGFATVIQSQVDGVLTSQQLNEEQLMADSINQEAMEDY